MSAPSPTSKAWPARAAAIEPVVITHHAKPRYVLMSITAYERLTKGGLDPRHAWSAGEAPPELAGRLLAATGETLAGGVQKNDPGAATRV